MKEIGKRRSEVPQKKKRPQSFTDSYIKSLKAEQYQYVKREGRGFGIRVLPSGVKTWLFIYTLLGVRRQMNLGQFFTIAAGECPPAAHTSLAAALKKYKVAYALWEEGIDPQAVPTLPEPVAASEPAEESVTTIAQLVQKYKECIAVTLVPRSCYDQGRTLDVDVIPKWGTRLINDISRKNAIVLLQEKADTAPGQARNIMKTVKSMYTYAVDQGYADVNPLLGITSAVKQIKQKKRRRWLSEDEIKKVWERLYSQKMTSIQRILLLVLLTGQRPGEPTNMEWHELEFGQKGPYCESCEAKCAMWTIPPHKIKTEAYLDNDDPRPHRVYLSPAAVSLLPQQSPELRDSGNHWVFPSDEDLPTRVNSLSQYVRKTFAEMNPWTPHDLRRTCASHLAKIKCIQEHIDKIQNHVIEGSGGTYNRYEYDDEKIEWELKWSLRLQEIIS